MKTAVSIPDPLFHAADQAAKRLRVSRSELYARALERYLANLPDEEVTARLDALYAYEDSRLDPALVAAQQRALGGHD
jgi:metal-responsive CopG/Arc/MetJ family transcriptional regulator